jgi:hypothetical protein
MTAHGFNSSKGSQKNFGSATQGLQTAPRTTAHDPQIEKDGHHDHNHARTDQTARGGIKEDGIHQRGEGQEEKTQQRPEQLPIKLGREKCGLEKPKQKQHDTRKKSGEDNK